MKGENQIFADNLTRLMDESGINQQELAKRLKTSKSAVSYWCRGLRFPNKKVEEICKALHCTRHELLGETDFCIKAQGEEFLLEYVKKLSPEGQQRLIEYAKDMVKIYGNEDSRE